MCSNVTSDDDFYEKKASIEDLYKIDKIDEELATVHEFLLRHNLQYTAEHLLQEADKMGYINFKTYTIKDNVYATDLCHQIFSSYRSGERKKFFILWRNLIPESIKSTKEYKTLTLLLHIHFAVLSKRIWLIHRRNRERGIHNISARSDSEVTDSPNSETEINQNIEAMKDLLKFLISEGKELENDPNLRPYFALPFMEDPLKEPFLSRIFHATWLSELTMKLETFLSKHKQFFDESSVDKKSELITNLLASSKTEQKDEVEIFPNDRDIPFLDEHTVEDQLGSNYESIHETRTQGTQTYLCDIKVPFDDLQSKDMYQELTLTKSHLYDLQSNYAKLNSRYHKLHTDYHKLINVAGELTTALDNSYRGQPVDLQKTLESCIKIFPDLFNQEKDESYDNERIMKVLSLDDNQEWNAENMKPKISNRASYVITSKNQVEHASRAILDASGSKAKFNGLAERSNFLSHETNMTESNVKLEKSIQAFESNSEHRNSYDIVNLFRSSMENNKMQRISSLTMVSLNRENELADTETFSSIASL